METKVRTVEIEKEREFVKTWTLLPINNRACSVRFYFRGFSLLSYDDHTCKLPGLGRGILVILDIVLSSGDVTKY